LSSVRGSVRKCSQARKEWGEGLDRWLPKFWGFNCSANGRVYRTSPEYNGLLTTNWSHFKKRQQFYFVHSRHKHKHSGGIQFWCTNTTGESKPHSFRPQTVASLKCVEAPPQTAQLNPLVGVGSIHQ
jgi:hypothetical protein